MKKARSNANLVTTALCIKNPTDMNPDLICINKILIHIT